ncbi:MAG TPA: O-antigen ligase family protein [Gemmatimonadales bacterium]
MTWPSQVLAPTGAGPVWVHASNPSAVNPVVRAALYLFVFSIPFEMPDRTIPIEVPTLTGFILLFSTVLNPSACFRRIPAAIWCFGIYLWTFLVGMAMHRVQFEVLAVELFLALLQLALLFWVIHNLLADRGAMAGALIAFVAAVALRAGIQVLGIGTTAHAVYTGGARITAFGQNANLSAMILAAGLAAVVGLRATARPFPRLGLLTWPIALVIGVAIIQTGSRGGLLCALAGLAIFAFRGQTAWQRVRNGIVTVGGLALLAWGALHSAVMGPRITQAEEGQLAGRERIYPAAMEMFAERPWFGWGPVDNQLEVARRIDEAKRGRRDAHNLLLELLTATGVIGAVPFLAGVFLCVRRAWVARAGPLSVMPLAMLVAVFTGTVSGTWIASKILWLTLAFALAAGAHGPSTVPLPESEAAG